MVLAVGGAYMYVSLIGGQLGDILLLVGTRSFIEHDKPHDNGVARRVLTVWPLGADSGLHVHGDVHWRIRDESIRVRAQGSSVDQVVHDSTR